MKQTALLALAGIWLTLGSAARAQTSPADSAALNEQLREHAFRFVMAWRYEWWVDKGDLASDKNAWEVAANYRGDDPARDQRAPVLAGYELPLPLGCVGRSDSLTHRGGAQMDPSRLQQRAVSAAEKRERDGFSCFMSKWAPRYARPHPEPRMGFDGTLSDHARQAVRELRKPLLEALDAGARKLPGDPWIAGQRVRMHVDHGQLNQAIAATRECRASGWWCLALRGYVWHSMQDFRRASAVFDSALAVAPDSVKCAWNDVSMLLTEAAAQAFRRLSCIDLERDLWVERLWWLADPLYLEAGNERRVEHYGRWMLVTLRLMTDSVDGIFDYRNNASYQGRYEGSTYMGRVPMQEYIIRYGYPVVSRGCIPQLCVMGTGDHLGPRMVGQPPDSMAPVQKWRRFDTKGLYLGTYAEHFWQGPRYHMMPSWSAVMNPLGASDRDWDVNPRMLDADNWDPAWWPPEFIPRDRGPMFNLPTQVAFLRRAPTALIAAAAEWDTAATFRRAPEVAVFGMVLSRGPRDTAAVIAGRVAGATPPPIFSPIRSEPVLIGIEMIPTSEATDGAAARTRFGASPPRSLARFPEDSVALSDLILVRSPSGTTDPATIAEAIERMYGNTTLYGPTRLSLAWELYGARDSDTLRLALRLVPLNPAGLFGRLMSVIGIGAAEDSLTIRWTESANQGAPPTNEGGVSVRYRTLAIDVSSLPRGAYSLEIAVDRNGGDTAVARRELIIRR